MCWISETINFGLEETSSSVADVLFGFTWCKGGQELVVPSDPGGCLVNTECV